MLAVGTYATFLHATNLGFGKHTTILTNKQLESVKHVSILWTTIATHVKLTASADNPGRRTSVSYGAGFRHDRL